MDCTRPEVEQVRWKECSECRPGKVPRSVVRPFRASVRDGRRVRSDVETSRIPAGTMASARGNDIASVPVFFSGGTQQLPVGTRVRVISDQEGDPNQPRRKVVVSIQAGPSQGLAGQMYRSDLKAN